MAININNHTKAELGEMLDTMQAEQTALQTENTQLQTALTEKTNALEAAKTALPEQGIGSAALIIKSIIQLPDAELVLLPVYARTTNAGVNAYTLFTYGNSIKQRDKITDDLPTEATNTRGGGNTVGTR